MDPSAELEISRHLDSGESLLWSGIPRQGLILRTSDAFMIPVSILWGGFAIYWEATAFTQGAPFFFLLFGIPFVVIGLYMIVGRFFVDARLRANTAYGLTDSRIIILSGVFSRSVSSMPLRTLTDLSLRERQDRSGTVLLGKPHPFASFYGGMQWPGMSQYETPSLELISDAKSVYDRILSAQKGAA